MVYGVEDNKKFKVVKFIVCIEQDYVNDLDDRMIGMQ